MLGTRNTQTDRAKSLFSRNYLAYMLTGRVIFIPQDASAPSCANNLHLDTSPSEKESLVLQSCQEIVDFPAVFHCQLDICDLHP